jgi:hypothetical protein
MHRVAGRPDPQKAPGKVKFAKLLLTFCSLPCLPSLAKANAVKRSKSLDQLPHRV